MHYGASDFSTNGSTVITTKPSGQPIGQRDGLSDLDVIKLRLLYQCISGPRNYGDYLNNICTSDCKCWEGATGCNGNNAACQGELVCTNNVCSTGGGGTDCTNSAGWVDSDGDGCDFYETTENACALYGGDYENNGETANDACCKCGGGSTGGGPTGGCSDIQGWVDAENDGCDVYEENAGFCEAYGDDFGNLNSGKTANEACCFCGGGSIGGVTFLEFRNGENSNSCLDLRFASTTNGNRIWLYECNGSAAQKWYVDSNFYIRSAVNTNKCSKYSSSSFQYKSCSVCSPVLQIVFQCSLQSCWSAWGDKCRNGFDNQ